MAISNFPNGFLNGVTIRGVPLQQSQPGEVFWVNSTTVIAKGGVGASDGNKGTYTQPFATIDYAIGRCTAGRGDIIMVMPGYTGTISAAGGITCDVSGVSIVGLGAGTLRPTITLDTAATASVVVSAANVSFKNIIFSANFADIVNLFTVTATDFHVEDCEFPATATDMNFLSIVDTGTTDNEVDNLSFLRCEYISPDLSTESLVNVDADIDGLSVVGCYINLGINGVLPCIAQVAAGKDLTNCNIDGNRITRLVTASAVGAITFVDTTTTNTGTISNNFYTHRDTAGELLLTAGTNVNAFNNYATGVIGTSGYLLPAADS